MRDLRRFFAHWQNILGLLMVGFFLVVGLEAPRLAPAEEPYAPKIYPMRGRLDRAVPRPPSAEAPLGTLPGQEDVFHSLVWGTRSAVIFGLSVTTVTVIIGILVGAASAYMGGWANNLIMRITDAFLAFPVIAGVVLFNQLLVIVMDNAGTIFMITGEIYQQGPISPLEAFLTAINPLMLSFIVFSWMPYARITNTIVLRVKQTEFIQAARAMGASPARIIFRHLIPNSIAPAVVLAARDVGGFVLLQATFTFINLGDGSIWGRMLAQGRDWVIGPGGNLLVYWWIFVPVTLALVLFGVGWNLLGDGLNTLLNPRKS